MPELPEIEVFARHLRSCGTVIEEIDKVVPHKAAVEPIQQMKDCLPLAVNAVLCRGKEIAIVCDSGSLVLGMGTGAAFHVGSLDERNQVPLKDRCNTCFILRGGTCIFILDCHTKRNQVTFRWTPDTEDPFDPMRGPHCLDDNLLAHLSDSLADEANATYYGKATLADVLLNQSLFNGIGSYSLSEIGFWFYLYTGIRPWANFKQVVVERGLLPQLVALVQKYFGFMLHYVGQRPYVPPTKYDEREWLSFRAVFLKVYRAQTVTIGDRHVAVVRLTASLTKAGASHMKVGKTDPSVFTPFVDDKEAAELPPSWTINQAPRSNVLNLGVGPYSWWGWIDKHLALKSEQKESIRLRPCSAVLLQSERPPKSPSKRDDVLPRSRTEYRSARGRRDKRLGGRARKMYFLQQAIEKIFS